MKIPVPPRRILYIEDDSSFASLVALVLEEMGHEVRIAYTGPDGIAVCLDMKPDLVLLDLGLPGLEGEGVAKRITELGDVSPFVVGLTGNSAREAEQRLQGLGVSFCLQKPVGLDELSAALGAVIERLFPPVYSPAVPDPALLRREA